MNKILLIGEFSEEMSKLREELIDVPNIQLCSLNRDNIRGVIKIINPDIIIACMVEADTTDKAIFKWLKDSWPKLPTLIISSENYWEKLRVIYNIGEWKHLYFPIDKDELLQVCSKMIGNESESISKAEENKTAEPIDEEASAEGKLQMQSTGEDSSKGINSEKPVDSAEAVEQKEHNTIRKTEKKVSNKKILIIDDSALILRSIKGMLDQKYEVSLANSGLTAISKLSKEIPDLILLDYEMPEMDGLEVYNHIRKNASTKNIPVVFLTSVTDKSRVISVLKQNPAGYIIKPPSRDQLLGCIDDILKD